MSNAYFIISTDTSSMVALEMWTTLNSAFDRINNKWGPYKSIDSAIETLLELNDEYDYGFNEEQITIRAKELNRIASTITVVPVGMNPEALEDFLTSSGWTDLPFIRDVAVASLLEVFDEMKDDPLRFVDINLFIGLLYTVHTLNPKGN